MPPAADAASGAYNLHAYLQQQIQRLQQEQPMVLKSVKTEDQPVETVETAKVDWEEELAMFQDLDLNKPTLQEYYTRTDSTLADGSISIHYDRRPDAEAPVQHLYLRLSPSRHLEQLQALVQDQNILFFTRRNLQLTADPANGNLSGYGVEGTQKLIFGDTLNYSVDTNL
ncbi:hypothetical protein I2I11_07000 [Pontibacter sp. 172403-2]|uniref:hypothetical protein n=1 Tax=Pontibacter rufus TaxID=2791028 RepID=UPI0018AFCB81|nr:hypothetical protein [Pontibacter sp. 172403-2]MBF9253033.1 hypothetical protein [Pontibacter sp. 172403-2]